jgi:hypothetical protein
MHNDNDRDGEFGPDGMMPGNGMDLPEGPDDEPDEPDEPDDSPLNPQDSTESPTPTN